jgi:hypothetical protein
VRQSQKQALQAKKKGVHPIDDNLKKKKCISWLFPL